MGYLFIWKEYNKNILSMAAFVAWLWFFPLFGILQTALPGIEGKTAVFNLTFLFATVLGYVIFLCIRQLPVLKSVVYCSAPVTAGFTWITAVTAWQIPEAYFFPWSYLAMSVYVFFPAVMGVFAAIYFAFWGTTIFYVSPGRRGRYMATMAATATVTYTAIVAVFYLSPLSALFLSGLFLFIPFLLFKETYTFVENSKKNSFFQAPHVVVNSLNLSRLKSWKAFWIPFSLTILCFYILSWAAHDIIFSVIKGEGTLLPLLGQASYALVFVLAGFFLDREMEIEKTAVMGLILLGCTFLLLPLALSLEVLSPLYFLLEGSYGLIDLFMWVSLAYFCQLLKGDPQKYYALGLLLNILFIIGGILLMPLLDIDVVGGNYFLLSLTAGIILFFGVLPALSLRRIRLAGQEGVVLSEIIDREMSRLNTPGKFTLQEFKFTPKEKEIIYLMLTGLTNVEIVDRLGVSRNTLKTHVRHIYEKAEVKNRSELLFKFADLNSKGEP